MINVILEKGDYLVWVFFQGRVRIFYCLGLSVDEILLLEKFLGIDVGDFLVLEELYFVIEDIGFGCGWQCNIKDYYIFELS